MYEYEASLMHRSNGRHPVYDGDTVWLKVDLGFGHFFDLGPCRLYGLDTPEVNRKASREAGIAARDFVREKLAPLEKFRIQSEKDTKGKYGRYLVRIYLPDGTCLNDILIATGHAVAKDY